MAERSLVGQVSFVSSACRAGASPAPGSWRRWRQLVALAGAALLAACATVVPKTTAPVAPPPPKAAAPSPTTALPTDAARNRVALLVPLTGTNAQVGQSIANATTLALLDTKTERLRVTTYDTGANPAEAARKAIADGNKLILGPLTADEVKAVAPVARAAKVPVIGYSNDASVAGNGVYLLGYAPSQSITRVVAYAHAKGAKTFAALIPKGVYGERAGSAFLNAVKATGATAVGMETFDRSAPSVAAALKRLSTRSSYDALLIADIGRIAVQIAPQVKSSENGANAKLLGTELWNTDNSLSASTALRGAWFASVSDGLYHTLASKYRASYGGTPYRLASLGYDSVLLTVRIAQDWKPGSDFPAARLTDPEGFAGIDGAFRFGKDSLAERALEIQQIEASGVSIVDSAPKGFGK